ncbi:hypothetical protein PYCCODRAFT_854268 [Trametes coccinea BRFM310]|uniref:Uncharacterized protein n=1 Tax=Trametes coccinea (strain BRFM310) TaxID=1353009 RepID=A0A1Y2IDR8_TRAC3|nr:hypothetical protein PYCCODRAFT_854268 [Trametes coccinea BRFM310]
MTLLMHARGLRMMRMPGRRVPGPRHKRLTTFLAHCIAGEGPNETRTMNDSASSVADGACARCPRDDPPLLLLLLIVDISSPSRAWASRDPQPTSLVLPEMEHQICICYTPSSPLVCWVWFLFCPLLHSLTAGNTRTLHAEGFARLGIPVLGALQQLPASGYSQRMQYYHCFAMRYGLQWAKCYRTADTGTLPENTYDDAQGPLAGSMAVLLWQEFRLLPCIRELQRGNACSIASYVCHAIITFYNEPDPRGSPIKAELTRTGLQTPSSECNQRRERGGLPQLCHLGQLGVRIECYQRGSSHPAFCPIHRYCRRTRTSALQVAIPELV